MKLNLTFKHSLKTLIFFGFVFCAFTNEPNKTDVSSIVFPWSSDESNLRFSRADKTDFFPLVNQFEAQENKFFCGPTSAVIVLNALRGSSSKIKKPTDPLLYRGAIDTLPKDYVPVFERYTQNKFFTEETDKIKTRNQVFGELLDANNPSSRDYGIQLRQFHSMLKTYGLNVNLRVVSDDLASSEIKKEIIENLKRKGDFVIVNYFRKVLKQNGSGHISPLAAYDDLTDSVLILDVNPSHQPWVWVALDDLIAAMRTKDTLENRGYLTVSEAQ